MDSWEEGFDTWTPPAGMPTDAGDETGTDLDRDELLRLARELASQRAAEQVAAHAELEALKQLLRERAEAVAVRERELDRRQQELESGRAPVRGRIEELRAKRGKAREPVDEDALAARERAALARAQALELRERELTAALAAAQAQLAETTADRELAAAERERLEERDRTVHEVEKQLAAARIDLEQQRGRIEARAQEVEARAAAIEGETERDEAHVADAGERELALEQLETKLQARERELALIRRQIDADRTELLERERALRRREISDVRESFAPPLTPPSFSEGLAAFVRTRSR